MTRVLWVALLSGHVAWTGHLLLSYLMAALACAAPVGYGGVTGSMEGGSLTPLHVATLGAVALAAVGIAAGRSAAGSAAPEGRFVGRLGLAVSATFLAAIVLAGAMPLVLSPCA